MEKTDTYISDHIDFIKSLRQSLLDFGRRNQHIYFKGGSAFISVKIDMDSIISGESDAYNLDIDDELLYNSLDRIRIKAKRNERELGFNQLKLVSAFINWYDKTTDERILSPLVLHDITLERIKGIEDKYLMKLNGDGILNPFLQFIWKDKYGYSIDLPDKLSHTSLLESLASMDGKLIVSEDTINENDPYNWQLDTQSAVVGNFDFRKMSVVEDYDRLLQQPEILDDLLSYKAPNKEVKDTPYNYNVLHSDPSQNEVVQTILNGKNITIQGPPGTGKSQTLVNICSNLVARGKSVLLVSEKRVALDVVHERLRETGLDDLCMYAHHSVRDRKHMIADLKKTYQSLLSHSPDLGRLTFELNKNQENRANCEQSISRYFNELEEKDRYGISLLDLYAKASELVKYKKEIENKDKVLLPLLGELAEVEDILIELESSLKSMGYNGKLSGHPISWINLNLLSTDNAAQTLKSKLLSLDKQSRVLSFIRDHGCGEMSLSQVNLFFIRASFLKKLKDFNCLDLFEIDEKRSKKFDKISREYIKLNKLLESSHEKTKNWISKPEMAELRRVDIVVNAANTWIKRTFNSKYKKAVKALKSNYNFAAHIIEPELSELLNDLIAEHSLKEKLQLKLQEFTDEFGTDQVQLLSSIVKEVRDKIDQHDEKVAQLISNPELIDAFYENTSQFENMYQDVKRILLNPLDKPCNEIADRFAGLLGIIDELDALCYRVKPIAHHRAYNALLHLDVSLSELQYACADYEISQRLKLRYWLKETDAGTIQRLVDELIMHKSSANQLHTDFIREKTSILFQESVELSEKSVVGMPESRRSKRKDIRAARKVLEHEFGKQKRYKSIRELVESGAAPLLNVFKPIWMLGPHAIADNLELQQYFDVVIFDEASQIRLEEGLPGCLRAKQVVIVGDEMQMPPSNFFGASKDDELPESLLSYFASKWQHKKLKWHYRSASKSLIDFSNKQFYNGELSIVPGVNQDVEPIERLYIQDGIYKNRRNSLEALAIAERVGSLLSDGVKSVGVVAFSLEQVEEIELALESKASNDPIFAELMNNAFSYERNNCFEGLFVKNLENVQGDERDVMIVSVGYAFDADGKFNQNFGPVSQKGGERRLNVLLTRARKKMILVTSVLSMDISGKSLGAEILRKYLSYAESQGMNTPVGLSNMELTRDCIELYEAMKTKGWQLSLSDIKTRYSLGE